MSGWWHVDPSLVSDPSLILSGLQTESLLPWLHKLALARRLMYSSVCRAAAEDVWAGLETIALTVSDANRSWKGDSTFGCDLLEQRRRRRKKESLTFGGIWIFNSYRMWRMCLVYSRLNRVILTLQRSSHAIAPTTLWCCCSVSAPAPSLTNSPFIRSSGRIDSAHARKRWIFEPTPGRVLCRQHLTGLKRGPGRYENRRCLSKPGNNQPPHPPQGPQLKAINPKQCAASTVSLKK